MCAAPMLVKLETADGGLVGWTRIPPFNRAPDVLIYGSRVFRYKDAIARIVEGDRFFLYVEAFAYAVTFDVNDLPSENS